MDEIEHGDHHEVQPARACKGDEVLAEFVKAGIHPEVRPPNFRTKEPHRSSSPGTT
jgi:hypothetical protein